MNKEYAQALKEFTSITKPSKYFIVGSISLLSYTESSGYKRQVNDIDVIMESSEVQKITSKLTELGYSKSTFIDSRMPFYNKLMKQSKDRYLRFSKDSVNIEILSTPFIESSDMLTFELYPRVKISFPNSELVNSSFMGTNFSTVSKELLYLSKILGRNTFGKLFKNKVGQTNSDITSLELLIDKKKVREIFSIFSMCKVYIFGIPLRPPAWLLSK